MVLAPNHHKHIVNEFKPNIKMKTRTLESDTRMRYLLGNNPIGELVKILSTKCKKAEDKRKNKNF